MNKDIYNCLVEMYMLKIYIENYPNCGIWCLNLFYVDKNELSTKQLGITLGQKAYFYGICL